MSKNKSGCEIAVNIFIQQELPLIIHIQHIVHF
jgi:hypothetical protein